MEKKKLNLIDPANLVSMLHPGRHATPTEREDFKPRTNFDKCRIVGGHFTQLGPTASGWSFLGAELSECTFEAANLPHAIFEDATITKCKFNYSKLEKANFLNASLTNCDFTAARMNGADFRVNRIDATTTFNAADLSNVKMTRRTAVILESSGIISKLEYSLLDIYAPDKEIRAAYSGHLFWINLFFIGTFLLPYILFGAKLLLRNRILSRISADPDAVTIFIAYTRYVLSGGNTISELEFNIVAFACFAVLLTYNSFRGFILWQLKKIELQEEIDKLPAEVSPDALIVKAANLNRYFTYISIVVLILHTVYFLMLKVAI